ncbi:hypothetical protein TURU_100009 [Turdus rufiventris]|nr:hypothetical protein TURU_100009 [Turdus rufiventris]
MWGKSGVAPVSDTVRGEKEAAPVPDTVRGEKEVALVPHELRGEKAERCHASPVHAAQGTVKKTTPASLPITPFPKLPSIALSSSPGKLSQSSLSTVFTKHGPKESFFDSKFRKPDVSGAGSTNSSSVLFLILGKRICGNSQIFCFLGGSICLPSDTSMCTGLGLEQSPSSVHGLKEVDAAVVILINKCHYTCTR